MRLMTELASTHEGQPVALVYQRGEFLLGVLDAPSVPSEDWYQRPI